MNKKLIAVVSLLGLVANAFGLDSDSYCKKVAKAAGGSYRIYESCLEEENAAKTRVENSSPSDFKPYYKFNTPEYGQVKISVREGFETLGPAVTFLVLQEQTKPKKHTARDSSTGKEVVQPYYSELSYIAVICDTTERPSMRWSKSKYAVLAQTYFDKGQKAIYRNTNSDTYAIIKGLDKSSDLDSIYQLGVTIEGSWSGLYYRIGCNGGK